jgi:hypothetical protein
MLSTLSFLCRYVTRPYIFKLQSLEVELHETEHATTVQLASEFDVTCYSSSML